jgi:hypothetical protein
MVLFANRSGPVSQQNESAKEKMAVTDFLHAREGNKVKTANQGRDHAASYQISHDAADFSRE